MLKSNQHSEQLGPLLATYPDATVVMIHRDPVATIQSLLTMRGMAVEGESETTPTSMPTSTTGSPASSGCCGRYIRDRHLVPDGQLVEVMFADIVADDVQGGRRGARTRRFGGHRRSASRILRTTWHRTHAARDGRVVYDLEGDFGLNADELRERFAFYIDEFDIRPEGGKDSRR